MVSAVSVYDPEKKGFIVTFTIDEGAALPVRQGRFPDRIPTSMPTRYAFRASASAGVYNAEAVEKSVEDLSIEVARRGYPFAVVRPRGDRDFETHTISIVFTVEDGPRIYIERINVRGNTRTRDYVIRREFDIVRGRCLQPRADRSRRAPAEEPRLLQDGEDHERAGSSPDRVILIVDVEEKSTGEFSVSGGYSTTDGGWPKSAFPNVTCSAAACMGRHR